MDPDKALADARAALTEFRANECNPDPSNSTTAAGAVAEAFGILDEWLSRGGALPAAWDDETGAVHGQEG